MQSFGRRDDVFLNLHRPVAQTYPMPDPIDTVVAMEIGTRRNKAMLPRLRPRWPPMLHFRSGIGQWRVAHGAFVASDLASFITGAYIPVCGGNVMPCIEARRSDSSGNRHCSDHWPTSAMSRRYLSPPQCTDREALLSSRFWHSTRGRVLALLRRADRSVMDLAKRLRLH